MNNSKRLANYELLRIIAIFQIVCNHIVRHGVIHAETSMPYQVWASGTEVKKFMSCLVLPGGQVGVAVFFLISGYFISNSKREISIKKVVLQSIEYSWVITFLMVLTNAFDKESYAFQLKEIAACLFLPISGGLGWFITAYCVVCLMAPSLNRFIKSLNKRGFLSFILVIWMFSYTVGGLAQTSVYMIIRGVLFYCIGAYLSKYSQFIKDGKGIQTVVIMIITIFAWMVASYCEYKLGNMEITGEENAITYLMKIVLNSICIPIISCLMFVMFSNLKITKRRLIDIISPHVFAIYLLHDSAFGRRFFWDMIFRVEDIYLDDIFLLCVIVIALTVIIVCMFFDKVLNVINRLLSKSSKVSTAKLKLLGIICNNYSKDKI